jgi:hypothetical protein
VQSLDRHHHQPVSVDWYSTMQLDMILQQVDPISSKISNKTNKEDG